MPSPALEPLTAFPTLRPFRPPFQKFLRASVGFTPGPRAVPRRRGRVHPRPPGPGI